MMEHFYFSPSIEQRVFQTLCNGYFRNPLVASSSTSLPSLLLLPPLDPASHLRRAATSIQSRPWPHHQTTVAAASSSPPSSSIPASKTLHHRLLSSNSGDPLAVSKNHHHHWNPHEVLYKNPQPISNLASIDRRRRLLGHFPAKSGDAWKN